MKGDKIIIESHHLRAADSIVPAIADSIRRKPSRYAIAISGESGSGKSETAHAILDRLGRLGIGGVVLGQDDYFALPPKANDAARRRDPAWLGPDAEVRLDLMDEHLEAAVRGAAYLDKPLVDYEADSIGEERVSLEGARVVIAEGTYTALLRFADIRIFIARTRQDTLEHRRKRNRGNEAYDPFVEGVLETEHKIIAGYRFLADFIITRDYDVIPASPR
jgi:uridine kinase